MGLRYFFIFSISIIKFSSGQIFGEICEKGYCIDGSSCLNNLCQCGEGLEHFATNGQCAKRVGDECGERKWQCVMGSQCDTTTDTCTCTAPSIPTENGACSLGFGSYCSKNQTCTPGSSLTCLNNRCACGFGTISEYDLMNPSTHMHVPGDCRVKNSDKCAINNGPKCVQNSQCVGGKCKCNSGFGDDASGQCKKLHSQSCIPRNVHYGLNDCNQVRGLFCIDDICQCQEPNMWDTDKQACLTGLGEICSGTGCSDPNAVCVGKYEFEPRRCECSSGFVEAQGICMKDPNLSNCECPRDGNTFDCTGKPCGNYPIKNDLTRFIQCTEGTGIIHSCPPSLEFNADISLCDMPHNHNSYPNNH